MKKAQKYRVHELRVMVMIHESIPETNDAPSLASIMEEIGGLAIGDVTIISASLPPRVLVLGEEEI